VAGRQAGRGQAESTEDPAPTLAVGGIAAFALVTLFS